MTAGKLKAVRIGRSESRVSRPKNPGDCQEFEVSRNEFGGDSRAVLKTENGLDGGSEG